MTLLDCVSWDEAAGWAASKGVSLELDDGALDATANDSARNGCQATSRAGSTSDNGSPGAASSRC